MLPAFATTSAQSLKGKSDEELLHLVIGGRNDTQKKTDEDIHQDIVRFSSIDRVWEMPPQQAALALASEYVEKEIRGRAKFAIDQSGKAKPPSTGEIAIRWISGNYYALPERGVIVLRYEGLQSRISISDFQILGPVSETELSEALNQMDDHPVSAPVAQQTYEVLWWLHRIRPVGGRVGGSSVSSVDDLADSFWMRPDGPFLIRTLLGTPNGEDLNDEKFSSFPAFAYAVIRRLIERQGIKPRRPLPTIGHPVYPNPEAAFLRTHPRPDSNDPAVVKQWVKQMIAILQNPERYKMYGDILHALVPTEDPSRYQDPAIDRILLDFLRGADPAATAHEKAARDAEREGHKVLDATTFDQGEVNKEKWHALSAKHIEEDSAARSIRMDADTAGAMIGFRDKLSAFSELMDYAKRKPGGEFAFAGDNCLTGAAALAGKYPQLRPRLASYLHTQLADIGKSKASGRQLFDCVWRADLRQLAPDLAKVATSSPEENEDPSTTTSPTPLGGNGKFHAARVILMAWRETDPLTKTKLDAMINGYVGGSNSIPEVLRAEFDKLSAEDQMSFRNFITWLRTVEVPWSRECLEDVFTPHTPRPPDEHIVPDY
jgi:hypothetical protein